MIKLTFPSLEHYLQNKVNDNEMKVFQRAWLRARSLGYTDLWSLISMLKRDRELLSHRNLYDSLISYWDNFKESVITIINDNQIMSPKDYPRVRFI